MGRFDNCLLAADVDGTLLYGEVIPKSNIEAIKYFISEGGHFCLCTGRSVDALKQVFRLMDKGLVGVSVVLGGGMIYDFSCDAVISQQTLSSRDKLFAEFVSKNYPKVGIEVHLKGIVNVLNRTYGTDAHEDYEDLYREFNSFEDTKHLGWNKVLYPVETEEDREALLAAAKEKCEGTSIFIKTSSTIEGKLHLYVEQLPLGVSKGKALKKVREILSLKEGGLFGIGDYYNDIAMLGEVDIGAVTAEAPDDLKKIANYITCKAESGAVADFINYLTENIG